MERIRNGTQAWFKALLFIFFQFTTLAFDGGFAVSVGSVVFLVLLLYIKERSK